MKYTEHLVFAALLIPTAAVLIAAGLSFAASTSEAPREVIALYPEPQRPTIVHPAQRLHQLEMDDEGNQIDATKRGLLERSSTLMGRSELAQRLNVSPTLLDAWMRGDATMPDGKLMELARALDNISRGKKLV